MYNIEVMYYVPESVVTRSVLTAADFTDLSSAVSGLIYHQSPELSVSGKSRLFTFIEKKTQKPNNFHFLFTQQPIRDSAADVSSVVKGSLLLLQHQWEKQLRRPLLDHHSHISSVTPAQVFLAVLKKNSDHSPKYINIRINYKSFNHSFIHSFIITFHVAAGEDAADFTFNKLLAGLSMIIHHLLVLL